MPDRAQVQSVDALKDFRARLCIFRDRAKQAVDEVMLQLHGMRSWLQDDQVRSWQREIDRRDQRLADARADLNRVRISDVRRSGEAETRAVSLATRALREAHEKLQQVRRWARGFETKAQPHIAQVRKLADFLDQDVPQAIARLDRLIERLSEYARLAAPRSAEVDLPRPEQNHEDGGRAGGAEPD